MKSFLWILFLSLLSSNALCQAFDFYVVDIGPDRGPPGVMGTIELQRITPDNVVLCETLAEGN